MFTFNFPLNPIYHHPYDHSDEDIEHDNHELMKMKFMHSRLATNRMSSINTPSIDQEPDHFVRNRSRSLSVCDMAPSDVIASGPAHDMPMYKRCKTRRSFQPKPKGKRNNNLNINNRRHNHHHTPRPHKNRKSRSKNNKINHQRSSERRAMTFQSDFFRNEIEKNILSDESMKDEDASIMEMGSDEFQDLDVSHFQEFKHNDSNNHFQGGTMRGFKSRHNYSSSIDSDKSLIKIKPSPKKVREVKIIRRESSQINNNPNCTKVTNEPSYGGLEIESTTFNSASTSIALTPRGPKYDKKSKLEQKRKQKMKRKSWTPSLTMLSEFTSQTDDDIDGNDMIMNNSVHVPYLTLTGGNILDVPESIPCDITDSCDMAFQEYIGTEYGMDSEYMDSNDESDQYIVDGETATPYAPSNITQYYPNQHESELLDTSLSICINNDQNSATPQQQQQTPCPCPMNMNFKGGSNSEFSFDNPENWMQALQAAYERGFNNGYSMGIQFNMGSMNNKQIAM